MYVTKFATKLYATNVSVERRYFKFQNEIQFSSNSIMEQLKHRDSDSFHELLLPSLTSYYLHDRSLLMSRRNIIPIFSYLHVFNSKGT